MSEGKWVVDNMRRDKSVGFRFERLYCANFEDAIEHALSTPVEWTKPHVHKVPVPQWYKKMIELTKENS